jgi:hypothetical protein
VSLLRNFTQLGRKAYRDSLHISVSPVSKGTWSVYGSIGTGSNRRTARYTGLTNAVEVEDAVGLAVWDLLGENR